MTPPPPISPLFPYTTLFRSRRRILGAEAGRIGHRAVLEEHEIIGRQRDRVRLAGAIEHQPRHDMLAALAGDLHVGDRKSTRLNSSHGYISYAVFCLKKKKTT